DPEFAEQVVPVDVTRTELAHRGVATVGDADRTADTEAALGEVEPVTGDPANPVVADPADQRRVDPALQDEILDQAADLVVHQRGHHGRAQPEATAQPAGHVVLAAALPDGELAGGP